jgi:hypothetical protein
MKYIIIIIIFLHCNIGFSQENKELKKIKRLDKMPNTYEQIKDLDTIFILYYKSVVKGLEQKIDKDVNGTTRYSFFNHHFFPVEIYDIVGLERLNFRQPIIMYKRKSYIRRNIKKTIDVTYLRKFSYNVHSDFYDRARITFIIDLDSKVKNKYKIIQVNRPHYFSH